MFYGWYEAAIDNIGAKMFNNKTCMSSSNSNKRPFMGYYFRVFLLKYFNVCRYSF
jgi:hypothetical protein